MLVRRRCVFGPNRSPLAPHATQMIFERAQDLEAGGWVAVHPGDGLGVRTDSHA